MKKLQLAILLVSFAGAMSVKADFYATYPYGSLITTYPSGVYGSEFTVSAEQTVYFGGVFDAGGATGPGLLQSHVVDLWSAGGTLLATTVVQAGTADSYQVGFRWNLFLSPVTLMPGQDYILGVGYSANGDPIAPLANIGSPYIYLDSAFSPASNLQGPPAIGPNNGEYWAGDVGDPVPDPPTMISYVGLLLPLVACKLGILRKKIAA